ncbi:hypothetical protein C2869_03450 [Saccharobesus litoralis]|uniref:Pectate lyase n=1 Tax=Saccharobesus litoralis TaxID=2172099 RepID=A0A2S0VMV4_9ALTE|nr:hypothetical protein [Saccharobesus litoralis]AWB65547.1 hypothetical protein C2869_03450 [Saccharobesus litoralis]
MKNITTKALLTTLALTTSSIAFAGGTLTVSNQTGVITIDSNSDWDNIVIPANTTLQARIHILSGRTNDVTIIGQNRDSSIIAPYGLYAESAPNEKGKAGKMLSNIYSDCNCTVSISTLTSRNPRKFHILGDTDNSKMVVDNVNIFTRWKDGDPHNHHTTDGFGGGVDSSIRNSTISTFDDSIKVYNDLITVEKVKVEHHENGAPYQFGWGASAFPFAKLILKGENIVLDKFDETSSKKYKHGVFGWVWADSSKTITRKVDFRGPFSHNVGSGADRSSLYTFGHRTNSAQSVGSNGKLDLFGQNCKKLTSSNSEYRQNSNPTIWQNSTCS